MTNEDTKQGFAGLSDLVSDVRAADPASSPEPSTPPEEPSSTALWSPAGNETQSKTSGSPHASEVVGSSENGNGSLGPWKFVIILGTVTSILAVIGMLATKNISYTLPSAPQTYRAPIGNPASTAIPGAHQSGGLQYEKAAEVVREAGALGPTTSQNSPVVALNKSSSTTPTGASPELTREAQSLLTALGYDPGPIDGQYGPRTAGAVSAFRSDARLPQEGLIDEVLLDSLRRAKNFRETVDSSTPEQSTYSIPSLIATPPIPEAEPRRPIRSGNTTTRVYTMDRRESTVARRKALGMYQFQRDDGSMVFSNRPDLYRGRTEYTEIKLDLKPIAVPTKYRQYNPVKRSRVSDGQRYMVHFHSGLIQPADRVVEHDQFYYIDSGERTYPVRKDLVKEIDEPTSSMTPDPSVPQANDGPLPEEAQAGGPSDSVVEEQKPTLKIMDLPGNGSMRRYHSTPAQAPFKIDTRGVESCFFVKMTDWNTHETVLTVFIHGGQSVKFEMPLGSYELKYASGKVWYGEEYLFGEETSYSKADAQFKCEQVGDRISGYSVELYLQENGNLETKSIKPTEF